MPVSIARLAMICPLVVLTLLTSLAGADEKPSVKPGSVTVHPASLELTNLRHSHALLVLGASTEGHTLDLTPDAQYASGDPAIAAVTEDGRVFPRSSGKTAVSIRIDEKQHSVPVVVKLPEQEQAHSFRHEVMPVLSKGGCNQGACHGYSLGKNGFHLSLRGADPAADFGYLTQEYFGRRINRNNPAASLLLTKPLGEVPHKGGVRFARGSLLHEILTGWIEDGAPGDLSDAKQLEAIEVVPQQLVMKPGMEHRLHVIAKYTDGTARDVTPLAVFTANSMPTAEVDKQGVVSAIDFGETAIVIRYERKFVVTGVIVLRPNPSFQPTPLPKHPIDRLVVEKLNALKIKPSGPATDEQFLRRIYLDVIGLQPTPDEVRAFLAEEDPNKRAKVLESLFTRGEFVDHWSLKWGDLLQNTRTRLSEQAVYGFRQWIRSAVASNMPLDEFARRILTSSGSPDVDPAAAYFAVSKDTNDTLERVTQVFCGINMLCARCHPHPQENWTQEDYYGLASFFNQVGTKADPLQTGVANAKAVILNRQTGFSRNPRSNRPQPPRYLGGGEPEIATGTDRREVYARWLASADNPFFARSLSNRMWSYFFHRGVIDPVDDLRTTNPPINPALLDFLARDLAENKFDMRNMVRRIVTSETYQRTGEPNESNRHDVLNFSHAVPRRLTAEAMLDSLVQATGVRENFPGAPAGFSAAQLPDAEIQSPFLKLFGKPQRAEACECERDDGSNMLQALHFINGPSILSRVTSPRGRVALLLREKLSDEQLVEELFLWTLARSPGEEERRVSLAHLKAYGEKRKEAAEDLMWALLNSKDFQLQY